MYTILDFLTWTYEAFPDTYPHTEQQIQEDGPSLTKTFPSLHAAAAASLFFYTDSCPGPMINRLEDIAKKNGEKLWNHN